MARLSRRLFLVGSATALWAPRRLAAQPLLPRVAIVSGNFPVAAMTETGDPSFAAFLLELRRLGLVDGATVALEFNSAEGRGNAVTDQLARDVLATQPNERHPGRRGSERQQHPHPVRRERPSCDRPGH
jgi:hypothetical protein